MSNNELIAEFIGAEQYGSDSIGIMWRFNDGVDVAVEDLKYDVSWDWLMPIVEKIERLFVEQVDQHNKVDESAREADIEFSKVVCLNITAGIEFTYKAVVQFIKWHNSKKQQ